MRDTGDAREIRVFISSPSDVGPERARAAAVLKELSAEFAGRYRLVPVLWEESYYSAHQTFQEAIPRPSSCELVVCILWKRLGTELPPDFNRPDGSPRTGTEYEFEEALEAALRQEAPDILVYRKRVLVDADRIGQEAAELRALNAFWQKWFSDERGNFTASFDRFLTEDEFEAKLKRQVRQWLARLDLDVTWPVDQRGSPFRSLEPFDAGHAQVFFGRRRAIRQAVSRLAAAAARGCPFLLVLGGSGTGKSSLVRAGIIPYLTAERALPDIAVWRVAAIRPAALGGDLLAGLAAALLQPGALPELDTDPASLGRRLAADETAAAAAIAAALGRLAGGADTGRLVLLVDQLEEVLLRPEAERETLIRALSALARSGAVWVIATLRSDRYAEFQASPGLVRLKADGESYDLLPPGPAEIREIIEGPARAAGLPLEETAERRLLALLEAAAQERGALPLLQFTLQSLFEARDPATGTLLLAAYDRLGGLAGAIAGEAERLVAALPDSLRAALPPLLLELVEIEDGKEAATARTIERRTLDDPAERDLAAWLVEARLLTADGEGDRVRLRLAHEALLTRWPVLADLVRAHRDFLALRRQLEAAAAIWQAEGDHPDFLLPSGRRLVEAGEAVAARRALLDPAVIRLVEASLAAERLRLDAEAELQRRELELRAETAEARERADRQLYRRTRTAVTIVSALLVATAGIAALWLGQRELARRHATEAEQNYTTALEAARDTLDIVQRAAGRGRVVLPVRRELLRISREAFENLPGERETTETTAVRARLLISLETSNDSSALDLGRKAVALGQALVARDGTRADWLELLQEAHWQLGSGLVIAGDLAEAARQFAEAEAITERWAAEHPDEPAWRRRLETNRQSVATIMLRRGDPAGALDRFRACHDLAGEGDALLAEGDLAGAGKAWRAMLAATEENARRAGSNENSDTILAQARQRVGDLLRVEGKLDEALKEYEASIKLGRGLFQNMLGNFTAARALYAASRGAADIALARGDAAGALGQYRAIAETVAKSVANAPHTPEWQAEQAEIDERIGDALLAQGDVAGAEAQYRSDLATAEAVTKMVADDAFWQRDVELAHGRLAEALAGKGDLAAAAAEDRTRIELAGRLVRLAPGEADWQRDLALGWAGLGAVLQRQNDAGGAAEALAQCRAVPIRTIADPRDERAQDPRALCPGSAAAP